MELSLPWLKFVRWAVLLATLSAMRAQTAKSIEVASIKPSRNSVADSNFDDVRGRLTATDITVKELIRFAFGVKGFQIERLPNWVDRERFDIVVKKVSGTRDSLEEEKALVRELLADRFQLAIRRELKQLPVYWLLVAKSGARLIVHNEAGPKTRGGCGRLVGRGVTADTIASMLARQVDREVVNRTGLDGKFDIQLDFTPDAGGCRGDESSEAAGMPSIFTALQQQLGLRLEAGKGPVEMLIVDRVERPSEN